MALNFPNGPSNGDTWVDPANGAQYLYAAATDSWSVTGITTGGGTVNSVNIFGTKGLHAINGPITDVGTITIRLDIEGPQALPILP